MANPAIDILIDTYVRNFATEAFHDMQLNRILHLLNQNGGSGSGGSVQPCQRVILQPGVIRHTGKFHFKCYRLPCNGL